jgi:hypothetical protein
MVPLVGATIAAGVEAYGISHIAGPRSMLFNASEVERLCDVTRGCREETQHDRDDDREDGMVHGP